MRERDVRGASWLVCHTVGRMLTIYKFVVFMELSREEREEAKELESDGRRSGKSEENEEIEGEGGERRDVCWSEMTEKCFTGFDADVLMEQKSSLFHQIMLVRIIHIPRDYDGRCYL
uniref:Uncharacterized protein n=1 Tax=Onchocerca volvulus TaxID=6282 RepID=A0A8R1TMQ0_ONCVO